jgi:hypothetical protein
MHRLKLCVGGRRIPLPVGAGAGKVVHSFVHVTVPDAFHFPHNRQLPIFGVTRSVLPVPSTCCIWRHLCRIAFANPGPR